MQLQLDTPNTAAYLEASDVIDFGDSTIRVLAHQLIQSETTDVAQAKRLFEFVRDRIAHSFDIQGGIVTCNASEVLQHRQGICFAKSHLLAALLRGVGIPAGLCYQRLRCEQEGAPEFSLHGLNAIYLKSLNRWLRVDARGNKPGVQAEFCLEREMLAFPVRAELAESDDAVIYAEPNFKVVAALRTSTTCSELIENLPDEL
jgi:transglutaminase-like putative cysteine protease